MAEMCSTERIVMASIDFVETKQSGPQKLFDLCSKKLISDVYLLERCNFTLPSILHERLLHAAINDSRILSVSHLLKSYPYETLKIPILDNFNYIDNTFINTDSYRKESLMKMYTSAVKLMILTFFKIVCGNNSNSHLRNLNLGDVFIDSIGFFSSLHTLHASKKAALQKTDATVSSLKYTLKSAVTFYRSKEVDALWKFINVAKAVGLDFVFTGIRLNSMSVNTTSLLDLLNTINVEEFQQFCIHFSHVIPTDTLFTLTNFKFLRHLNISYLRESSVQREIPEVLAKVLPHLSCLEWLTLTGMRLTDHLPNILSCEHRNETIDETCCLIHHGKLQFLNVSFCRLTARDIAVLKSLAVQNCLKFLNISSNPLNSASIFDTLFSLRSSLCTLEIEDCFQPRIKFNPTLFPVKHFEKLRFLNVKRVFETDNCYEVLDEELAKLPNKVIVKK